MRLRRLDLAGFKTFADRTALEFSPRITAIVGPNGSGKSNIFDAIRWALGEGSLRSLRGVRNEDVIFAGAERRRQLGMAEVTLTLDNADGSLFLPADGDDGAPRTPLAFAEVTVTRRALRAADSQYQINGLACRLRDIQTMFLGTGLGGHSYALITQGEVDHTLAATPEERRMILEEAAGVAKYKRRRRDAERRMTAADQLLLRVADILGEQESHVVQLAAQAEAARQYQDYTRELRAQELAVQVEEVRRLGRAQRRVREQLEQIASHRRELDEALGALEAERESLDRRAADAGRDWDAAQRALVNLTERRAAEEAAARLFEERRRGVETQRDRVLRDVERYREEQGTLERERAALDDADRALSGDHDRAREGAEAAERRLADIEVDAARAERRLDEGRREARTVSEARGHAHNALAAAEARAAGHRERVAAVAERIAYLDAQDAELGARRRDLADALEQATADLAEKRSVLATLRDEQARETEAREDLVAGLHQAQVEREAVRARLRHLEEAHAHYRGYDAGAREMLLARQRDPTSFAAIQGAVVECLSVPREIRVAVEAALGPAMSALIVMSVDDVRALRARWTDADPGIVTFLPVALARYHTPAALPDQAAADPGVRGRALDLVQITGAHREVIAGLLADVVVVEDLEAALRIRAAGYEGRLVTLAGDGLTREGVLTTGWRMGERETVVGRAEEIDEARAALALAEETARQQGGRVDAAAARLREVDRTIAEAEAATVAGTDHRTDAERRLTLADAETARVAEERHGLAAEREAARREVSAQETLRDALAAQAETLDGRLRELETEAASLAALLRDLTGSALDAREAITGSKVTLAEIAGKRTTARVRRDELARLGAQVAERCAALGEERSQFDLEAVRLASDAAAARGRSEALAAEVSELERSMQALDAERAAVASRRTALDGEHRAAVTRVERMAEDAHRAEVRQAQVDAEMGSARRRIEEEFGQGFDRAAEGVSESLDRDETLGRIDALRGLIAALGPVNLIAIDEHRQAAVRAEALRAHFDDVQGTLAALRATIADLEMVIRERFDETFQAVNVEFGTLFTRLFGGGRAGLALVEVEGSDEPGVDITVQPPGKTLRSLSALSGGERVMVALALIFAMLRVRPSPFCVFDEVEAALDEANTRKVAEVLVELAERSQIIIITHNKATMEVCDVLFGVTMEEPGVSHMVSMKMQERDGVEVGQPVG